MGGNSSKDVFSETSYYQLGIPIKGLKSGDVVTLRGEMVFLQGEKMYTVEFKNGDDIAFHFKIIFLEEESHFNKVKMNTFIGGKWEKEVLKENCIYLNHFFELKFKCFEDKFVVEIDGNDCYDYAHRVSPDKITHFQTDGQAILSKVEVPNKVYPYNAEDYSLSVKDDDAHFPSADEVLLFVQSLTQNTSAPGAGTAEEEFEKLSEFLTDGLKITKIILEEKKGSFIKDVMKYGGYLSKAFKAGQAVFGVIEFFKNFGKPSGTERIIKKLDEIHEQLKNIEKTIEKGFADVIEHMDYLQFRENVSFPVGIMFDLYVRCYTVSGKLPMDDFSDYCTGSNTPRAVFSTLYQFLDSRKSIFETHLKTQKYVYSVYDEWSTAVYNYASKLVTMNMFLLGIRSKKYAAEGHTDLLIDEEREAADLISQLHRMDTRLNEIEENRMKTFHTGGYAGEFLREAFKKVKYERCREDYYIMVVRGRQYEAPGFDGVNAGWHIGDPEKVTVIKNIGQVSKNDSDCICLALIQPVTNEIREANEKVYKDKKEVENLKEVVEKAKKERYVVARVKEFIHKMVPYKPLLIMYNTDYVPYHQTDYRIEIVPISYEMTSESWSSAGGPLPLKYRWALDVLAFYDNRYKWRREVQIVFQ